MCLTFSLMKPEDALLLSKNIEVEERAKTQEITQPKALPAPAIITITVPTTDMTSYFAPHKNLQHPLPLENAVVSYVPQQEEPNFDLMALIVDVQSEEIPDEDLLLAATQ